MDPILGEIKIFAGTFAPVGWEFCNGQLIPISSNQALFSLIGTIYGGDGRTTFALPNLGGRVPIHANATHRLGAAGGVETVTLQEKEMPSHTHTAVANFSASLNVSTADATTNTPSATAVLAKGLAASGRSALGEANIYGTTGGTAMNCVTTGGTVTNSYTGGNNAHTNMQPYLSVNFIIAMQGTYPSRP